MPQYTIPVMVIFPEGTTHVHLWAITNMFQQDTWIFAAPNPAGVGIDLITDMKRALISENYGIQKLLIVLYPMKQLHTEFRMNYLICIHKVLNGG